MYKGKERCCKYTCRLKFSLTHMTEGNQVPGRTKSIFIIQCRLSDITNNKFLFSEDDRKLFVGGLPQEAKDLDIKEYFGQYGEIDNINLKTDPHTGRSRGFAFIVFKVNLCINEIPCFYGLQIPFPFLYELFSSGHGGSECSERAGGTRDQGEEGDLQEGLT